MQAKREVDADVLRRLLARWCRAIESAVRSSRRPEPWQASEYSRVHAILLDRLARKLATLPTNGPERRLYVEVIELCRPWLSLDAIRRAHRNIQVDVLARTRNIERQLFGDHYRGRKRWIAALASAMVVFAGIPYAYSGTVRQIAWRDCSLVTEANVMKWDISRAVECVGIEYWLAVLTITGVVAGICMVQMFDRRG